MASQVTRQIESRCCMQTNTYNKVTTDTCVRQRKDGACAYSGKMDQLRGNNPPIWRNRIPYKLPNTPRATELTPCQHSHGGYCTYLKGANESYCSPTSFMPRKLTNLGLNCPRLWNMHTRSTKKMATPSGQTPLLRLFLMCNRKRKMLWFLLLKSVTGSFLEQLGIWTE